MKLSNINKPTSPFWNKVALACTTASAFIAGYGAFEHSEKVMIAGGILGVLGSIIPIFASNGEN